MYLHSDKEVAFLAHPKTASSATAEALLSLGFERVGTHHEVTDIPEGWSVISTIRQPFDLVVSWYFHFAKHSQRQQPAFGVWLRRFIHSPPSYVRERLFFGLPATTHVLVYENLQEDLDWTLNDLDLPVVELPVRNVGNGGQVAFDSLYTDSDLTTQLITKYEQDIQDYSFFAMDL